MYIPMKEAADKIIGSNDNDGIAEYLEKCLLKQEWRVKSVQLWQDITWCEDAYVI